MLGSVSGFNALIRVAGALYVWGNADLETFSGFDMLETVGGEFGFYENNELGSVSGFGSLRDVGPLTFENNPLLTSVPDFPSLTVANRIILNNNPMLGTLPSFDRLETLRTGNLGIMNLAVTSISGFPSLTTIRSNLSIGRNSRLRSVSGFPSLTTTGGFIIGGDAGGNPILETVSGFPALRNIGASGSSPINISGNLMLTSCCVVFPFVQTPLPPGYTLGGNGAITISNNASGCNSAAEIRATTGCPLTISVDVTLDSLEAITDAIRAATRIEGNLTIGDGEAGTDITNAVLAMLRVDTITGNLTINRTQLTELDAFSQLRRIEGNLDIGGTHAIDDGNRMMTSVSGFGRLERIEGRLYMEENDAITTITAFEALDSIGGELKIASHNALVSLPPFTELRIVGDGLHIINNDLLTSVTGFSALGSIGGRLEVLGNRVLESLPPFTSLRSIGARLWVRTNRALTSLPAFPALRSIGSTLGPSASNSSTINISFNRMLSTCCGVFPFVQSPLPAGYTLGGDGMSFIFRNEESCGSTDELKENGSCLLELSTTPDLIGLPAEAGTITVDLTFLRSTTGWEASAPEGSFLTVPSSGSSTSFTVSYEQNTAFAPRIDTLIITPTGSEASVSPLRLLVLQRGTARAILGDVVLDSLEAITTEVRDAQYIMGNLTIRDREAGRDITNTELARLQVEEIAGNLTIDRTKLATLDAFASLRRIEGSLNIGGIAPTSVNIMLRSVSGFGALDSIGGSLIVSRNVSLISLGGFSSLRTIGRSLLIVSTDGGNRMLESVSGFDALDSIGGGFFVSGNASLSDLDGFSSLRTIRGNLLIGGRSSSEGNAMLVSLPDFKSLRSIETQLYVNHNGELTSLPVFPALRSIGSRLSPSTPPIDIQNNAMLSTCCVLFPFLRSLDSYTLGGGEPSISDNGADCTSTATITAAGGCHGLSASATASNIQLSEGDTIEVLLSSHIGTASLIINTEGGASGWTAARDPDGALITAVTPSGSSGEALELTLSANTTASLRRDTVTLSTTGTGMPISKTLSLTQAAMGTIVGDVALDSLEAITEAIRSATRIEGSLLIGDGEAGEDITNTELARLQVETITGALTISDTRLATLDAFSELTTIGDSLVVRNNALLDSLLGFSSLNSIGAELASEETPLLIEDNGTLSLCCGVSPFVQASLSPSHTLGGNATARIEGNATGCTSDQEVRNACIHTISLSTTTSEVEVGAESGGTIPISLPSDGTEAVFTIALGGATGFRAEETSDEDNFVTHSVSGELLTISYSANPGTTTRTAAITLSTEGPGASITRTLSLTQVGAISHTISLSTTTDGVVLGTESGGTIPISLPADGTEAVLTVALGIATGFTAEEASDTEDFLTHSTSENTLTISYSANPGTTSVQQRLHLVRRDLVRLLRGRCRLRKERLALLRCL